MNCASADFWVAYAKLPRDVRKLAQKLYALFRQNPQHPSLRRKVAGGLSSLSSEKTDAFWLQRLAGYQCLCYVPSMPDNVQSAMFEILKSIQSDVSELKGRLGGVEGRLGGVEGRLDRLEALVRRHGRDSAAMLVMMRGTVGIYDERMKVIEEDVRLLMEQE